MKLVSRRQISTFLTIGSLLILPGMAPKASASVGIPTERQRFEQTRAQLLTWIEKTSQRKKKSRFDDQVALNDHLTFNSKADALAWANTVLPSIKQSFEDPNMTISTTDPRIAVVEASVQELWGAYTSLFPAQTRGLNVPPVILLDSKVVNAFVHQSADGKQMAHAIFVFTGLLDLFTVNGQLDKAKVTAVIGHELAHSVFLHGLSKYQTRVNHFYDRTKIPFGYQSSLSPDTAALDQNMGGWLSGAMFAGELTSDDIQNLPSPSIRQAIFMSAFRQFQIDNIKGKCTAGTDAYTNWRGFLRISNIKGAIEILQPGARPPGNTSQATSMTQASSDLMTADRQCVANDPNAKNTKYSLIDLTARAFGISPDALKASEEFVKLEQIFQASPDVVTGFQNITAPFRSQMKEIEAAVDFNQINYYTFEEHADEVSALIHTYLNRDPNALGTVFLSFLNSSSPDDAATCANMIATKTEPPNGSYADPHRALCFRDFHIQKFASSIGSDVKGFAAQFIKASIGMSLDEAPLNIK
jgi:Peptidase family M48